EKLVQVPNDCTSLNEYLKRFDLPNKVMQSSENIKRITFELLEDAQKENIKYIEIRFAPLLHLQKGLSIEEIIQNTIDRINQTKKKYKKYRNKIFSIITIKKRIKYRRGYTKCYRWDKSSTKNIRYKRKHNTILYEKYE